MRFFVFAGECYYPGGGWEDFIDEYETKEKAVAAAEEWEAERGKHADVWWHVVDIKDGEIVASNHED